MRDVQQNNQGDEKSPMDSGLRCTEAELYISLDGHAVHLINGQKREVYPYDVFVLPRDVSHGQLETKHYRYCVFKFNMDALQKRAKDLLCMDAFHSLFVINARQQRQGIAAPTRKVNGKIAKYAAYTARMIMDESDSGVCDMLFYTLVSILCKNASPRMGQSSAADLIAETAAYMECHYKEALELGGLAERTHYSKRHLTRLFREYYDLSPMDYVNQIRLRRATAMLLHSCASITQVAETCGFADSSQFSKHFRRRFGVTPSAYRKQHPLSLSEEEILLSASVIEPGTSWY